MKNSLLTTSLLCLASAVLMSIPWLVPHSGAVMLVALVPLLCAERIASGTGLRRFWMLHYATFVLWNALTTFWVCNATVGGGLFAIFANAAQMSLIFGLFRISRRHFKGVLPYLFLVAAWIAWEHFYFSSAEISWPWLALGNAFAGSTRLVQWYSVTGVMGGTLWIWAGNLALFGIMVSMSESRHVMWTSAARLAVMVGMPVLFCGPVVLSAVMYACSTECSEDTVDVIIGQPNFDPYEKFESLSQNQQDSILLSLYAAELDRGAPDTLTLLLAPETFTSHFWVNNPEGNASLNHLRAFMSAHPHTETLFGASSYEFFGTRSAPSILARPYGSGWYESHNSAVLADASDRLEIFHKSKLVVGTELTPYPRVFVPFERRLASLMGVSGLMGHCQGQDRISLMHLNGEVPLGCAVCYESIYGGYCTGYVDAGAKALAVITNDAWWGDTPGYRQHFNYSRLRAIELRRDIARCGNTGISAFINQRGDVVQSTDWWVRTSLRGTVNLSSYRTFYSLHGDFIGRIAVMMFCLMLLAMLGSMIRSLF